MAKQEASPLLSLLDQRWQDEIKDIPDPTPEKPARRPYFGADGLALVRRTSREYAEAHSADPFAFFRCRNYIARGYWAIPDVQREVRGLIASRKSQGITFPIISLENA